MIVRRLALAVSGWVAMAFTALQAGGFPRVFVVSVFLVLCPGLAAVRWARPPGAVRDPGGVAALESCLLAVVLSLTLSLLVAEALFLAHAFTLHRALLILAALTSVLALVPRPGGRGRALRGPTESRPGAAESPR